MLETIPLHVWLGVSGAIGAGIRGLMGYAKIKKEKPKTKFEWTNFGDSIWQGVLFAEGAGLVGISMFPQAIVVGLVSGWTGASVGDKFKADALKYINGLMTATSKKK